MNNDSDEKRVQKMGLVTSPVLGLANRVAMVFHGWLLNPRPFLGLAIIVLANCGLDDQHDLDAPNGVGTK